MYAKMSPKNVNPWDTAGNAEDEEEEGMVYDRCFCTWHPPIQDMQVMTFLVWETDSMNTETWFWSVL